MLRASTAAALLALPALLQGQPGGSATCTNPTCSSPPCKANVLGDVGCTTVSGTETYAHEMVAAGGTIASNAHIFGPFEAGFSSQQDSIIRGWGCSDPSLVYDTDGGKDLDIAEKYVAKKCGITLPRVEGNTYYGIVGECGGHTGNYHFHTRFKCLYTESGGHSTKVGVSAGWNIYGKWEDYSSKSLPYLDACGGHFGPTPESSSKVYHYHAQDRAPFSVGCHGPSSTGGLVSLATCRGLYSECDGQTKQIDTPSGAVTYDPYCPCFDADGSNVGTKELPALSTSDISYTDSNSPTPSPTPSPSPSSSPTPTPSPSLSPSPTTAATTSGEVLSTMSLGMLMCLTLASLTGL